MHWNGLGASPEVGSHVLEEPVVGGVVRMVKEHRGEDPVGLDSVDAKEVVYPELYDEFGRENDRTISLPIQSVGDVACNSVTTTDLVGDAVRDDAISLSDLVGDVGRDSMSGSEMLGDDLPSSSSFSVLKSPSRSYSTLFSRGIGFDRRLRLALTCRLSIRYSFPFPSRFWYGFSLIESCQEIDSASDSICDSC